MSSTSSSASSAAYLLDDFTGSSHWYKADGWAAGGTCAGTVVGGADAGADPIQITYGVDVTDNAPGGTKGLQVTSGGAQIPGYTGIAVNLSWFADSGSTMDVSAYTGVTFWAKGTTPTVKLSMFSQAGEYQNPSMSLTSTWQQFQVPFSSLASVSWNPSGTPAAFDTTKAAKIQFDVAACGVPEFTIQGVGFY